MNSRVQTLLLATASSGTLAVVPLLIAATGASTRAEQATQATVLSAIIGFQVGLTISQQALLTHRLPRKLRAAGAVGGPLISIAAVLSHTHSPVGASIALVVLASAAGLVEGDSLVDLCTPEDTPSWYREHLTRNALLLTACATIVAFSSGPSLLVAVAVILSPTVRRVVRLGSGPRQIRGNARDPVSGTRWLVVGLGFLASSIYRNDVTIFRLRLLGTTDFRTLSFLAASYTVWNGLVGLLCSALLLPHLRHGDEMANVLGRLLPPVVIAGLAVGFVGLFGPYHVPVIWVATFLLTASVTLLALVEHVRGRSTSVYVVGVLATGVLAVYPNEQRSLLASNVALCILLVAAARLTLTRVSPDSTR